MRRIAEREVVTVVLVVGNQSVGIDRRSRKVGLVALRASRDGHGIGVDVACFEKILRRVAVAGTLRKARAPAVDLRARGFALAPRAVAVLELRKPERLQKLDVRREGDLQFPGFAAFGGDQHRTVCGLRTVECRGGSSRHHRHRRNVVRVQIGDGLRGALRVELHADELLNIGIPSITYNVFDDCMIDFMPRMTTFETPPTPDDEALTTAPATLPERALMKLASLTVVSSSGATWATV